MNPRFDWLEPELGPGGAELGEASRLQLAAIARHDLLARTYTGTFVYPVAAMVIAGITGLATEYPRTVAAVIVVLAIIVAVRLPMCRRALLDTSRPTPSARAHIVLGMLSGAIFSSSAALAYLARGADAATSGSFVVIAAIAGSVGIVASTHRRVAMVWVLAVMLPPMIGFAIDGSPGGRMMLVMFLIYVPIVRKMIAQSYAAYWDARINAARFDEQAQEVGRLSRRSGMAENATNVLHDVGNALNVVKTAAFGLAQLQASHPARDVRRLTTLLVPHVDALPVFFASDRGARVMPFLAALADASDAHAEHAAADVARLQSCLAHIEAIVRRQQEVAKGVGDPEACIVDELVRGALGLSGLAGRSSVTIECAIDRKLTVAVDRHRTLQILVNLLENARDALAFASAPRIRISAAREAEDVVVLVQDNGCGIAPEAAARIFSRGFTTKDHGHGFGLHGGFVLAQAMGGDLSFESSGVGSGAVFRLRLPAVALARAS